MNIVAHNLVAMNAQRQLGIQSNYRAKSMEKLSSGYRINRAADDAAGLSISEKMRRQIRGLCQASQNIQDGISFVQTADGALNEVHDILQRMNELSVKAANGTNTETEREYIQQEISHLTQECDRIFKDTKFNDENIWCEPYIPYVTGIPRELKIYNETVDQNGNITMGGIIWGAIKCSWDDIDPDMYDGATGKFNAGTYEIDVPAMTFNIVDDVYEPNGNTITLSLKVSEEGELTSISRECGWSADANGITMDGVLYQWSDMEDVAHNKTFNPDSIQAGNWGFNTYNGTHVWFEIPEGASCLEDVIDGINGTLLDHLKWETQVSVIRKDFAVGIQYGTQAAYYDTPILQVTNATKDYVTDKYYLHADTDGVWATNEHGVDLGKETYTDLGWVNGVGEFFPPHNNTWHTYYTQPGGLYQPDNHDAVTGSMWHYTSGTEGYNATLIPGLDVQFMVMEEASKQGFINGIDGVVIQADIRTPSGVTATTGSSSGKIMQTNGRAELSFAFHKTMGRDFDNASATLGTGTISTDGSGKLLLEVNNAGNTIQMTARESESDVKSRIESLLNQNGGTVSIHFEDVDGNLVEIQYELTALTEAQKKDIADGYTSLDTYRDEVFTDILGGTVALKADGYAEQSLGYDRSSVTAVGWANTKNNLAAYANFRTKISYTRELDIQAGGESGEVIQIQYEVLNAMNLGVANVSVLDQYEAQVAIGQIKEAMEIVSTQRSLFGAYQNRLEHAKLINDNVAENTMAAESRIRDTDMAKEAMKNSLQNIILQAGQAMLAQANQSNAGVINLLG